MYVMSLRSNEEEAGRNPAYAASKGEEKDGALCRRPDLTLGGSGGRGARLVGDVPKYGKNFYVQVQQLTVT